MALWSMKRAWTRGDMLFCVRVQCHSVMDSGEEDSADAIRFRQCGLGINRVPALKDSNSDDFIYWRIGRGITWYGLTMGFGHLSSFS
jgi:hypothetical protein